MIFEEDVEIQQRQCMIIMINNLVDIIYNILIVQFNSFHRVEEMGI